MTNAIKAYLKDESAAVAVEYGVVIALLSAVLIAVMLKIGVTFNDTIMVAVKAIKGALTPAGWDPNN